MWNPFEIGELEIVIAKWHGAEYVRPGHSDNGHFGSFSEFQLKILNGEYHQIRLYMCFKLLQSIFNCHIAKFHKILRHLWRFQDVRMDYLSLKLNSRDFPRCWFWHHQKSSKIPHGATLPLRSCCWLDSSRAGSCTTDLKWGCLQHTAVCDWYATNQFIK